MPVTDSLPCKCHRSVRCTNFWWDQDQGNELGKSLWTPAGRTLYIPQNATKDTPAPGVVTIEGWYNNKEMQELYSIELARRG